MKFVLSQTQVQEFFDTQLKKLRPELFDLSRDILVDESKVWGYQFYEDSTMRLFFTYKFEPQFSYDKKEELPKLVVTSKLANLLTGLFGEKSKVLIKNWFEKEYNYPINTVEFK